MRELLSDPIMQDAIVTLQDENLPAETDSDNEDAIASVRKNSRRVGWTRCLQELLTLADPLPRAEGEAPRDYGTGINPDQIEA